MGFALTPGEAPLHFSRSKNVMHVAKAIFGAAMIDWEQGGVLNPLLFLPRKFFPADWFSCDILFQ